MIDPRFAQLPRSLSERAVSDTLADGVPALIATPDGDGSVPFVLWMHGRTVSKELDPGRYLRWIRAGIGAVAVDLPGHGARAQPGSHDPQRTPEIVAQMVAEIDAVLGSLRERHPRLDMARAGIGGMSAGGMVALRRLCDPHPFVCAAVEGTTGDLRALYAPRPGGWPVTHDDRSIAPIDAARHLEHFRPIPVLALHNQGDEIVPIGIQRAFLDRLREHYRSMGHDPSMVRLETFDDTGAPQEHAGFGRRASDAKDIQLAFLAESLRPERA